MKENNGVSPVIGVALIIAVTVAVVSLVTLVAFNIGDDVSNPPEPTPVDVQYQSESAINVQLLSEPENNVIIQSALGTEYQLSEAGDSVIILNQVGNQTPVALGQNDGDRTVLRQIPPKSFKPDIVVNEGESLQTAVNNAQNGDVIVVEKSTYTESVSIDTSNITLVGEEGATIDSSTDPAVDITGENVRVSNLQINGSGGSSTGINGRTDTTLVQNSIKNIGTETSGDLQELSGTQFLPNEFINPSGDSSSTSVPNPSGETQSVSCTVNGTNTRVTYQGVGNDTFPYKIDNVTELQCIERNDMSANYTLASDVDASVTRDWSSPNGFGFDPIGSSSNFFLGSFDGQGYEIHGLYINNTSTDVDNIGLFANSIFASYSNLTFLNITIKTVPQASNVGVLAGQTNGGSITNISVTESELSATGTFSINMAGLVGEDTGGSGDLLVSDISISGVSISHSNSAMGGVFGTLGRTATVRDVTVSDVELLTPSGVAGGFMGITSLDFDDNLDIVNVSVDGGLVRGSSRAGGFSGGLSDEATVTDSSVSNIIVDKVGTGSSTFAGGFIARVRNPGATVSQSVVRNVSVSSADGQTGGFVGQLDNDAVIRNSYVDDDTSVSSQDTSELGGFAGVTRSGTVVENVYMSGNVTNPSGSGFTSRADGSVFDAYWDTDNSNATSSVGSATNLTTTQIQGDSASDNMNFDFTNTWAEQVSPDDYPVLRD